MYNWKIYIYTYTSTLPCHFWFPSGLHGAGRFVASPIVRVLLASSFREIQHIGRQQPEIWFADPFPPSAHSQGRHEPLATPQHHYEAAGWGWQHRFRSAGLFVSLAMGTNWTAQVHRSFVRWWHSDSVTIHTTWHQHALSLSPKRVKIVKYGIEPWQMRQLYFRHTSILYYSSIRYMDGTQWNIGAMKTICNLPRYVTSRYSR